MNPLRFIKRLPVYWNRERNYQAHSRFGFRHEVICYDDAIRFTSPNDALVLSQAQNFIFESAQRCEARNFLRLANGCTRLIDAGASAGLVSMLFAASRKEGAILSVEPDPRSLQLLTDARRLNLKADFTWQIAPCALSDHPGVVTIDRSGLGATVSGVHSAAAAVTERVTAHTLASLCRAYEFRPDLLKIDIESFEYEVLLAARDWLAEVKPRVQVELHIEMLRRRGLDPIAVARALFDLNYSDLRLGRNWTAWESRANGSSGRSLTHFWLKQNGTAAS